uniref:WH2 domain-containing protein n=1 Tax=Mesocestoides corti TaxID=53468 RepID=A0A5K3EVG7_MESCO
MATVTAAISEYLSNIKPQMWYSILSHICFIIMMVQLVFCSKHSRKKLEEEAKLLSTNTMGTVSCKGDNCRNGRFYAKVSNINCFTAVNEVLSTNNRSHGEELQQHRGPCNYYNKFNEDVVVNEQVSVDEFTFGDVIYADLQPLEGNCSFVELVLQVAEQIAPVKVCVAQTIKVELPVNKAVENTNFDVVFSPGQLDSTQPFGDCDETPLSEAITESRKEGKIPKSDCFV